jgi:hypothetical protein
VSQERTVKDPVGGASVTLHTSSDSKGVYGADGRRYFMDLSRIMPRDANYKDEPRRYVDPPPLSSPWEGQSWLTCEAGYWRCTALSLRRSLRTTTAA